MPSDLGTTDTAMMIPVSRLLNLLSSSNRNVVFGLPASSSRSRNCNGTASDQRAGPPPSAYPFLSSIGTVTFSLSTLIANAQIHSIARETSRAEMSAAKLPIQYRDNCAHLAIPLNRCRFDNYYLPWKCEVSVFDTTYRSVCMVF